MNILVTGANGQLGNELRLLAKEQTKWNFIFTDVTEHPTEKTVFLDITKPVDLGRLPGLCGNGGESGDGACDCSGGESGDGAYDCSGGGLDYIINCAAYTNVDAAEDNEAAAYLLNCTAARNLAELAARTNAALVHISTDYVFDGNGTRPYKEDDIPCPVSAYGRTKLAGEQAVTESGCSYVIIRTAWLYSEFGKNFMKTMLRLCNERDSVSVVNDQTGTPTYARDLAEAIISIIRTGITAENQGIYHYSNEGVCSWYDFATAIAELAGKQVIIPCTSDQFPSKVNRPAFSVLDKTKIKTTFGITVPHWQDSLKVCYSGYLAG